jgi:hypothetical protein
MRGEAVDRAAGVLGVADDGPGADVGDFDAASGGVAGSGFDPAGAGQVLGGRGRGDRGGSWLEFLSYRGDQRQRALGAGRSGENVVHGLGAAAQVVVFLHVEATGLAFDVGHGTGVGLELEDCQRAVEAGVRAEAGGDHKQGYGGKRGGRDQVPELVVHDLPAADVPAQHGLVHDRHERRRGRAGAGEDVLPPGPDLDQLGDLMAEQVRPGGADERWSTSTGRRSAT